MLACDVYSLADWSAFAYVLGARLRAGMWLYLLCFVQD